MLNKAPILTDVGLRMLTLASAGERLEFSGFAVGSGTQNLTDIEQKALTGLQNKVIDVPITAVDSSEPNFFTVQGEFNSNAVNYEFKWTEFGLYASCGEYVNQLYAYILDLDGGMLRPTADNVVTTQAAKMVVAIGDATQVTAKIEPATNYVDTDTFNAHKDNTENPHNVTAEQVGLENVPNVSTNNQTPTYNVADTLSAMASGEKMSTAFGKIAKAVSTVKSHTEDKNNPHNVTARMVTEPLNVAEEYTQSSDFNNSAFLMTDSLGNPYKATPFAIAKADYGSTLLNGLVEGTSVPKDTDTYISSWVGGSKPNFTRRPMSALWSYIKSKIKLSEVGIHNGYLTFKDVGGGADKSTTITTGVTFGNVPYVYLCVLNASAEATITSISRNSDGKVVLGIKAKNNGSSVRTITVGVTLIERSTSDSWGTIE